MIKCNSYQINTRRDTKGETLKLKLALLRIHIKIIGDHVFFPIEVQQNYWRLKKKKWEIGNVIGLASTDIFERKLYSSTNYLKDMNANTNINETCSNVWTTKL